MLTVRTRRTGSGVTLQIADTGKGLTPDQQRQLFVPFFSTKTDGTGLGLAMAEQIVTEHAGRIECTSEVGKGTTFTLYLPPTEETNHDPKT